MPFTKKPPTPPRTPARAAKQPATHGRPHAPSVQLKQTAHGPARPQAPPPYVPRQTPKVAQPKPAAAGRQQPPPSSRPAQRPVAPPAYRPQPAPRALQLKPAGSPSAQKPSAPKAPPVYRPQPTPKVLQTKAATATQPPAAAQAKRAPAAPPVYRPQPTPKVLQRKLACAPQPRACEQGARPHDPRAPWPHARHGGAVQRHVPHGLAGVVQLAISISGKKYTHGSKNLMNTLYSQTVLPRLNENTYKTYGVKSKLVQFVKDGNDHNFTDENDFWNNFHVWLQNQTRNVKGNKTTPVLKKFDVSAMSRPAWTEEIKQKVGYKEGENIRHVVRNATLKRALDIEYKKVESQNGNLLNYFAGFAQQLGVQGQFGTAGGYIEAIYKAIYLNRDNLFSGEALTNQIIGFAADRVHRFGEELVAQGEQPVLVLDVYKKVMELVWEAANSVFGDKYHKQFVVGEIDSVVQEATKALYSGSNNGLVSAELAGDLVSDIGLNFGFDLIDGNVLEDQQDISQRQGRLLQAETRLQGYLSGNSQHALVDILKGFMNL